MIVGDTKMTFAEKSLKAFKKIELEGIKTNSTPLPTSPLPLPKCELLNRIWTFIKAHRIEEFC